MASFCGRFLSLVADDEDACGDFDDVVGDGFQLVDFEGAGDLWQEMFEESEVAAGDAFDRGFCLGIGEVIGVEALAQVFPVPVKNEEELFASGCPVSVGEAEGAVALLVVAESLVDAGHADEDHRYMGAVVEGYILGVTVHLLAGGSEVNSVILADASARYRLCGKDSSPCVLFAASRTSC